MDQETLVALVGDVTVFKKNLIRVKTYLTNGVADSTNLPSGTQRLLLTSKLAQDYDLLTTQLNNYRSLKISSIPMLDDLFMQDLKKFDSLDAVNFGLTLNLKTEDFNENYKEKILFHVTRILNDISAKEEIASEKNQEAKKSLVSELQKKQDLYVGKLAELKKLTDRLNRVVSSKDYSATDDGSDNMISLLENYKNISEQIYGEWGEKFLKYTTQKSYEEAKNFKEKLSRFNTKYGDKKTTSTYICQDIQKIRINFKYADSLVQEGYDFIVTNKDLFNTDTRNYYNNSLDEESNDGSSSIENIQRHYKSTVLALKKLKKENLNPSDEVKYLSRSFAGTSYLGKSLLDVSSAKYLVRSIQDKFEQLNCNQVLVDEIN